MINDEIIRNFRLQPTAEQLAAINVFSDFMLCRDAHTLMILRGCAGTGKTTLASAIVRTLHQHGQKTILLAPTGRAAKVFSLHSHRKASTIHRKIYRQKTFTGLDTPFTLDYNRHQHTLFIVDEASMIGRDLLDDLMRYVYSGTNCHLMLIGDRAQLPPVGYEESPALDDDFMGGYGMQVFSADLSEVLRQAQESGILFNATQIRNMADGFELPKIQLSGFSDVRVVPGGELIEQLNSSYSRAGMDDTMVVCRSNKRAIIYNNGIRNQILGRETELESGDRIMVVKNKYLTPDPKSRDTANSLDFIANGDIAIVRRVRNIHELYGFRFADVTLEFPDYDNQELQLCVVLDSLQAEAPALTREENERLFWGVYNDYAHITLKSERMRAVREDKHYGALQIKYAYAVTCHKAQGGQWEDIFLDQGYMTEDMLSNDYIHWLYTAFTRATTHLYLVNWPTSQIQ